MRFLIILIFIWEINRMNYGVGGNIQKHNLKHNGHCHALIANVGDLAKDERKPVPGHCIEAECRPDHVVVYRRCVSFNLPKNSTCVSIKGDRSKSYPICCDQILCPYVAH